ncbi:ABC transporter permease [Halobium palmae]|uniref:ABC transporter permease n=1 Tax=Halobium palmae TaxID=1776492 RepID=A0ABD5RVI9_9EURY
MKNALAVARQDLLDAYRSYLVWGVTGTYVVLAAIITYVTGGTAEPTTELALQGISLLTILLVPLVALVAGYLAIAGERESGTIRLLLGYPNSRAEVFFGKLISRLSIVGGAIVAALLAGAVVAFVRYPSVDVRMIVGYSAVTVLFTSAYVAVAVGVSAMVKSRSRAMASAVGFYFLFNVMWSVISPVTVPQIVVSTFGRFGVRVSAEIYQFLLALSPPVAYTNALELVSPTLTVTPASNMDVAYLEPEVMVLVLVGWIVAPLTLGYLRFRSAQLS